MSLVHRRILHRLFVLLGSVTADQTSGGGAEDGVVAGIMSGDAADDRALDAAFRIGRDCRCDEGQRERKAWKNSLHVGLLTIPRANQRTVRSDHAGLSSRQTCVAIVEFGSEVGFARAQRKLRLSASARSVRSQEKPPSFSGARPKCPYAAVRR